MPNAKAARSDEKIALADLLDLFRDRGVNEFTLVRLRTWGFVSRPEVKSLGDAGTASLYPAATVAIIERYLELQEAARRREIRRNMDEWLWCMWFEGYPVNVRDWAIRRLDGFLKQLAKMTEKDLEAGIEAIARGEAPPGSNRPVRAAHSMRLAHNRVRKFEDRIEVMRWALAVIRGDRPEVSLYEKEIEPSPLEIVLKIGGLSLRLPAPDASFRVEESSIANLRETLAGATDEDMERARKDLAKFNSDIATIPIDGIPRHARRALKARKLAITRDTIEFFRAVWRNPDSRPVLLAKSVEQTRPLQKSAPEPAR